jgi:membrane protein DedA with SNARE-associated domain
LTLGALIETHGYWVLAVGCVLEGESALLLAGLAAHAGYLNPFAVVGVAALSGFVADQFCFWLGRRHGAAVLARWPTVAMQAGRVRRLIERHPSGAAFGVRFAYGLRTAGLVLIGMSRISAVRFAALNALASVLWAALLGGAGWAFGQAARTVLGGIGHAGAWLVVAILGAAAIAGAIRLKRARRGERQNI